MTDVWCDRMTHQQLPVEFLKLHQGFCIEYLEKMGVLFNGQFTSQCPIEQTHYWTLKLLENQQGDSSGSESGNGQDGEHVLIDSDQFDGMTEDEAQAKQSKLVEQATREIQAAQRQAAQGEQAGKYGTGNRTMENGWPSLKGHADRAMHSLNTTVVRYNAV